MTYLPKGAILYIEKVRVYSDDLVLRTYSCPDQQLTPFLGLAIIVIPALRRPLNTYGRLSDSPIAHHFHLTLTFLVFAVESWLFVRSFWGCSLPAALLMFTSY